MRQVEEASKELSQLGTPVVIHDNNEFKIGTVVKINSGKSVTVQFRNGEKVLVHSKKLRVYKE